MKHHSTEPVSESDQSGELRQTRRELARANARLERLQQRKSSLLAMAAHDLRTPLAIIQGYSQLLETSLSAESDPTIREYLTTIVAHAESLRNGIENLVALDQLERGEVRIAPARCDLIELAGQALAQVEGLIAIKGLDVIIDMPVDPVWVMADEAVAGRALYSLLSHAEKYARERGQLFVVVAAAGEMGLMSVRDPDRRLTVELAARVFDLVEPGRDGRAAVRGTDLGLVVARRVAEAHGGRADVASSPDQGTTFSISLPLATEEPYNL